MALIEVREASRIYRRDGSPVRALDSVSLEIDEGEFTAVIGRSGSGKSTLMNLLGCLDTADEGSCRIAGEEVAELSDRRLSRLRGREIGFIFQGFNLISGLTAQENVELQLLYQGVPKARRRALARDALARVGLADRAAHRPGEMSGGQQQRVAIARAVAASPHIILADEPTGNLDRASGEAVLDILTGLWREGRTLILITHDPAVAELAPRVLTLCDGRIASDTSR